jgi:hypothetical protein
MMVHVKDALRKLSVDPERVFPVNHGMSREQLKEVRVLGGVNPSEKVYELVLRKLKQRALENDLKMEVSTMAQMASVLSQAGKPASATRGSRGVGRSANSVSTGLSTLTMNTVAQAGRGSGGGPRPAQKPTPCTVCSLFHRAQSDGKCPLVDSKGRPKVSGMMNHRSTTNIGADGKKTLSEYWRKKFNQFFFPKLKYSQAEGDKVLKELKAEIAKLPVATRAEIEKFAESQVRFTNLAKVEDQSFINTLRKERNTIVNYVQGIKAAQVAAESTQREESGRSSGPSRRVEEFEDTSSERSSNADDSEWDSDQN